MVIGDVGPTGFATTLANSGLQPKVTLSLGKASGTYTGPVANPCDTAAKARAMGMPAAIIASLDRQCAALPTPNLSVGGGAPSGGGSTDTTTTTTTTTAKKAPPWPLIAAGVAALAVGAVVAMKRRG